MDDSIKSQIDDFLREGLVEDIFKAERSYLLALSIGEHSKILNSREGGNFGILFGAYQHALQTDAIVSLSRIYDRPNKKYQVRSICSLIQFIEQHKTSLPLIRQAPNLIKIAKQVGMSSHAINSIKNDQLVFAQELVDFTRTRIQIAEATSLKAMKSFRDKKIAHNEITQDLKAPLLDDIETLLNFAKDFIGLIGWAYLDYCYQYDG